MTNLYEKLQWQLQTFEDPVIVMNNLLFKKLNPNVHPIPPDGAILPDPSGSGIQIIIDNKTDALDLHIIERAERS